MLTITPLFEWFGDVSIDYTEQDKQNQPMIIQKRWNEFVNVASRFGDKAKQYGSRPGFYHFVDVSDKLADSLAKRYITDPNSQYYNQNVDTVKEILQKQLIDAASENKDLNRSVGDILGFGGDKVVEYAKEHPYETAYHVGVHLIPKRWAFHAAGLAYNSKDHMNSFSNYVDRVNDTIKRAENQQPVSNEINDSLISSNIKDALKNINQTTQANPVDKFNSQSDVNLTPTLGSNLVFKKPNVNKDQDDTNDDHSEFPDDGISGSEFTFV